MLHSSTLTIFIWVVLVRFCYLLLFPLTGLVQSSNPETSERHEKKTWKFQRLIISVIFIYHIDNSQYNNI